MVMVVDDHGVEDGQLAALGEISPVPSLRYLELHREYRRMLWSY